MSIIAKTDRSAAYLGWLKKEIDNGGISSWSINDGSFCHEAKQVKGKCYFKPEVSPGILRFKLYWCNGVKDELDDDALAELRAELHAHAVRLFMIHGADMVTSIEIELPKG